MISPVNKFLQTLLFFTILKTFLIAVTETARVTGYSIEFDLSNRDGRPALRLGNMADAKFIRLRSNKDSDETEEDVEYGRAESTHGLEDEEPEEDNAPPPPPPAPPLAEENNNRDSDNDSSETRRRRYKRALDFNMKKNKDKKKRSTKKQGAKIKGKRTTKPLKNIMN